MPLEHVGVIYIEFLVGEHIYIFFTGLLFIFYLHFVLDLGALGDGFLSCSFGDGFWLMGGLGHMLWGSLGVGGIYTIIIQ